MVPGAVGWPELLISVLITTAITWYLRMFDDDDGASD